MSRFAWHSRQLRDVCWGRLWPKPRIMTFEQTVEHIVTTKCSVARICDGELGVACGKDLNFQTNDAALGQRISDLLTKGASGTLVCLPPTFYRHERKSMAKVEYNFWTAHFYYFRPAWNKLVNRRKTYGNAWITRIYSPWWDVESARRKFDMLSRIWRDRDIVFIEGEYSRLGVGNDCFDAARSIRRIIAPAKNAFAAYDRIMDAALTLPSDTLVLIALGPTATVLAADLASHGYQAIDMGHLDIEYEWMRLGAKTKIPVTGKFVNEAFITGNAATEVSGDLTRQQWDMYQSQIINRI